MERGLALVKSAVRRGERLIGGDGRLIGAPPRLDDEDRARRGGVFGFASAGAAIIIAVSLRGRGGSRGFSMLALLRLEALLAWPDPSTPP